MCVRVCVRVCVCVCVCVRARMCACGQKLFVSYFSHVLLLQLVKVPLIVFLHYEVYVDVFVPLSQLVALGKNNIHY